MSNIVQIKRGNTEPSGVLQPYELGYCTSNKSLYIGEGDGGTTKLAQGDTIVPTTALLKSKLSRKENQILQIYCYNLKPNTTYKIYLYTMQKSRGNASRFWRHPLNSNEGAHMGQYTGYANIIQEANYIGREVEPIPTWMPNHGVLQTEWEFTTGNNEYTKIQELRLCPWITDLLKPGDEEDTWVMMGVSRKQPRKSSRQFQFKIVQEDGAIGETNNTLYLSGVVRGYDEKSEDYQTVIDYFSIK